MQPLKPGTPEYEKSYRKALKFMDKVIAGLVLSVFVIVLIIYFDIPRSEQAKIFTTILLITSLVTIVVALVGKAALTLENSTLTRLHRLKDGQSRKTDE